MFDVFTPSEQVPQTAVRGRAPTYPFATMKVGEAFDAPDDMGLDVRKASKRQRTIGCAACGFAKRQNFAVKFATRKIGDVIRCYRIA